MPVIYTTGYLGKTQNQVAALVQQFDAVLVDIRYSAFSRNPSMTGPALKARLGKRYAWCKELGNVNYRDHGKAIRIADYTAGKALLDLIVHEAEKNAILLCACRDYDTCHRKLVADFLRRDGYTVQEIGADREQNRAKQLTLF